MNRRDTQSIMFCFLYWIRTWFFIRCSKNWGTCISRWNFSQCLEKTICLYKSIKDNELHILGSATHGQVNNSPVKWRAIAYAPLIFWSLSTWTWKYKKYVHIVKKWFMNRLKNMSFMFLWRSGIGLIPLNGTCYVQSMENNKKLTVSPTARSTIVCVIKLRFVPVPPS